MGIDQHATRASGEYRWLLSAPSAWPAADPAVLGLVDPAGGDVGDLLAGALHDWRGESYLTFHRYQIFTAMYRALVRPAQQTALAEYTPGAHAAARKAFVDCARRIAVTLGVSQGRAEGMLAEADDLMTRHPRVAQRLRDGVISVEIARKILERTNLIDDDDEPSDSEGESSEGLSALAEVDAAIAAELDRGAGAWSIHLVRDMADRIVFRSQPDAVRARREASKAERRVWTANKGDDMGLIAATMTGERIRISMASVLSLAKAVCDRDPRTAAQRNSDAVFALLNQLPFACACDDPRTCTAPVATTDVPGTAVVPVKTQTVVHVVADKATVDRRASHPGFMDGHGVVSGDHIHDLLDDPTTVVRPLGPDDELAVFLTTLSNLDDPDDPNDLDGSTDSDDPGDLGDLGDVGDVGDSDDLGESATGSDPTPDTDTAADDSDTDGAAAAGEGSSTGGTRRMRAPGGESPTQPAGPAQPDPTEPVRPTPTDPGATTDDLNPDAGDDPGPDGAGGAGAGAGGGVIVLPGTQPHNPYRPSTALDTFIRIRDCYTLIPGNPHSAFHCDLDHWTEFDHADPAAGGQTEPGNLGAKDRFAHNAKTHGDWVDDLITDPDGHVRPVFVTPEGTVIEGRAGPGLDLFPGLARYRFTTPQAPGRRKPAPPHTPSDPYRTRTADKHARRRAERDRNRRARARADGQCIEPPAVRAHNTAHDTTTQLGDPPY